MECGQDRAGHSPKAGLHGPRESEEWGQSHLVREGRVPPKVSTANQRGVGDCGCFGKGKA